MGLKFHISTVSLISVILAACASAPTYRPMGPGETVGYTDIQLAPNRYRVTFAGSSGTSRAEVEDYLLRRAAEVTTQAGYSSFMFDTRSMEASTYYRTTFDTWAYTFGPRFGPQPWYGPYGWYWSSWHYPPMWDGKFIPVTHYTAYAEILMLSAEQASDRPDAIPARPILDRFAPILPRQAAGG